MADVSQKQAESSGSCSTSVEEDRRKTIIVEFDDGDDPQNPLAWSRRKKWTIVVLLASVTMIANLATLICIPSVPQIMNDFDCSDPLYATILVSIWELGEAVGPLFTAPLSEIFGRLPVYNVTNTILIAFSIACALSTNIQQLIIFRFLAGAGDASIALNASIAGDMFPEHERGAAIAFMSFPALVGPVAGPIIGGYLAERAGWRWTFWLCAILASVCQLCFIFTFQETYKPGILRRKARNLRKQGKDCYSVHDFDAKYSRSRILLRNLIRPGQMLVQSPIVLLLAIYISVDTGILYVLFTTIAGVFRGTYHFTEGQTGLSYLGVSTGMTIAVILCALSLDRLYLRHKKKHGFALPESRLPPMLLGAILVPMGLLLYGWTAQSGTFFIFPIMGTATVGFSFYVTTIPLQSYFVDAYPAFAASAVAATVVCRCVVSAVMPLAGPPLYGRLGYGWGNTVLAIIATTFIPVPLLLLKFGKGLRERTCGELMQ